MRLRWLAIALATGGWVCQGSDDNPCPGALSCAVDVANVCCPFGRPFACDGTCTQVPCAQSETTYACVDPIEPDPTCPLTATVDSATCSDPIDGPQGIDWHVRASGTVSGCGSEGIYIGGSSGLAYSGHTCGNWKTGMFDQSCFGMGNTTWTIDQVAVVVVGTPTIDVTVRTGAGNVLATMQIPCR